MKTATLRKSNERLDNGTAMPFKIVISGMGSELYASKSDAQSRCEDLKKRGYRVAYFA